MFRFSFLFLSRHHTVFMFWSGLVRVRRTSRFWLEYQFCLRNIWKHPQLIWRVENRWKHLQVLLKMTTVWLELQSAALLAVLIIIDIIILLFFHWSIISSMSLFSLSVRACEQSVDSSFPRLLVSCPLRGVSSRCLCTHYIPIRTAVEEHCVNLLIRPPRRSCTANIQTHLLPLCVGGRWVKVVKGWRHLYSWKQRESADGCFQEREKVLRYRFTVFVF